MAKVRDSAVTIDDAGTNSSITGNMPIHVSGDVLFAWFSKDTSNGGATSESGSWTQRGSDYESSGTKNALYYKVATGSSETAPVISTSDTDEMAMIVFSVSDLVTADIFNGVSDNVVSSSDHAHPALTTDENNCLIVYLVSSDGSRGLFHDPGVMKLNQAETFTSRIASLAGWTFQQTLGAVPTPSVHLFASDDGVALTLALNSLADVVPAYADMSNPPTTILHPLNGNSSSYGGTSVDPTSIVGTIGGIATSYEAFETTSNFGNNPYLVVANIGADTVDRICCNVLSIPSTNLTGKQIIGHSVSETLDRVLKQGSVAQLGALIGFRSNSGTAYRIWHVAANNSEKTTAGYMPYVVDLDDTANCAFTAGVFNSSDVDGIFMGVHRVGGDCRIKFSMFHALNTGILLGGSASSPGTFKDFAAICNSACSTMSISEQGSSQIASMQDLQIGNGSNAVYFKDSGFSVEFPKQADEAEKRLQYWPAANTIGLNVVGRTGDTISIKDGTVLGGSEWNLDWDVTGITPTVSGLVVQNALVTYTNAPAQTGITYRGCDALPSGSDIDGLIDASSSATSALPIAGATEAELQSELDELGGSEFINNAIALRINFTGTGNISLIGPAALLFASNTVDLHYNSTNASTCTFTPGSGSNPATTSVSGNASTVINIDSSVAITLVAANLIDGTRYQIYNVTQSAELYNAVVSGGTGISQAATIGVGLAIEVSDELRLRAAYGPAAAYKKPIEASIVANASSNTWINSQSDWTVVNDLAVDGSALTEFSADYTDDEIDVTFAGSFSGVDLQAWWAYNLTTALGIANFYGAVTLGDGYILNHNDVVSIYLDNTTATNIRESANVKIFRDDGAYPVKGGGVTTGGGGIDIKWRDPIYTKTLSGSVSQDAIDAIKAKTDQLAFAFGSVKSDVRHAVGVELQGDGTESNSIRAVGVDD
jgi:hypothetical protein